MKKITYIDAIPIGFAMFSMFFGAGNIIFPLAVGQYAGDKNSLAIFGLILTGVLMPFAGVLAMILFKGNYQTFFGRLGKFPGFLIALTIISLLGPLGSAPRCIALTYTTLKNIYPSLSLPFFSALSCVIIFLLTLRKNHILSILGWILTPILLATLACIVILGLMAPNNALTLNHQTFSIFMHGLKEGYNTMDLLAAFFFSSAILSLLQDRVTAREMKNQDVIHLSLQASLIGASLLTLIYVGFSFIASFHGHTLQGSQKDELLSAIVLKVAGPFAGLLVCLAIALACLTTAIALIAVFTDFFQKEVFKEKTRYEFILAGTLVITFVISTLSFNGISAFLGPILQICYPGLIILTLLNILHRFTGFTMIKLPVFLTFAISLVFYLLERTS